jgi:hypothetical protein
MQLSGEKIASDEEKIHLSGEKMFLDSEKTLLLPKVLHSGNYFLPLLKLTLF